MNDTMKFTALQLLALSTVYGVTWAGIYGISFPLFIMAGRVYKCVCLNPKP
jgi:hypothetical protein